MASSSSSSSNAMAVHRENLLALCRICGSVMNDYMYKVSAYHDELQKVLSVDFNADVEWVHPPTFCLKCYSIVNNCINRKYETALAPILWLPHSNDNCNTCVLRAVKSKGGRPKKKMRTAGGRPRNITTAATTTATTTTVSDILKLDDSQPIPASVEKALSHVLAIKMRQSQLPNNTVQLATLGSQPLTVTPVAVARKGSQNVTKRTLRNRTKQTRDVMKLISGGASEAITTQTTHIMKSFNSDERGAIISDLNQIIQIPSEQVAAMKTCLGLPWNLVREMRRWFGTFKVNMASEGSMRTVVKEWVGSGLHTEEIPATVIKNKRSSIVMKPWCYIYNLVGYVIKYLDDLHENNLLYDELLPKSEIHLKVGGDHGGGSFKMAFQVANVINPNKPENTVLFSIMEAKDYKSNLKLCLERFRRQIDQFSKVSWQLRNFRVFLFGDYEFLCTMYGLSGAAGKHPCLWFISSDAMQFAKAERSEEYEERSLETLERDLKVFCEKFNGNLKKAMFANNVIDQYFFAIPLCQVCIPGLHLTLGIYLKMFGMLEKYTRELDSMIAAFLAGQNEEIEGGEFGMYVQSLKDIFALESEIQELDERCELLQNEIDWSEVADRNLAEGRENQSLLDELCGQAEVKKEELNTLNSMYTDKNFGPCQSSLDVTLKSMGIERQAYHGSCLVGNQCHTLLKDMNIDSLCKSIPAVVFEQVGEGDIYDDSLKKCDIFKTLFTLYSKCHVVFNSAQILSDEVISDLERDIVAFMAFFRDNWPDVRITPKLHILEDHTVPFLKKWHGACGFYGEQGGESIHAIFNKKKTRYSSIKKDTDRLTYLTNEYLASTNPKARSIRVQHAKKARNLKSKTST